MEKSHYLFLPGRKRVTSIELKREHNCKLHKKNKYFEDLRATT